MLYCEACGYEYEPAEGVRFCEKCGAKLAAAEETSAAVEQPVDPKPIKEPKPAKVSKPRRVNPFLAALIALLSAALVALLILLFLCLTGVVNRVPIFTKDPIMLSQDALLIPAGTTQRLKVTNYGELDRPVLTVSADPVRAVEIEVQGENILLTGQKEGMVTLTISAPGCKDAQILVQVSEREAYQKQSAIFHPAGKAFEAGDVCYYFLEDGVFFAISDEKKDYIYGTYETVRGSFQDVDDASAESLDAVLGADWSVYKVTVTPKSDVYCGYELTELEPFNLFVAYHGEHVAIVDYNWYSEGAKIADLTEMLEETVLEDAIYAHLPDSQGRGLTAEKGFIASAEAQYPHGQRDFVYSEYVDRIYTIRNGQFYVCAPADLGTGELVLVDAIETETYKQMIACDGGRLFFTASTFQGGSASLFVYDYDTTECNPLTMGYNVQNFVVAGDDIFVTDYDSIIKVSLSGEQSKLYEGDICGYAVTEKGLYVFDYFAWHLVDTATGEVLKDLPVESQGRTFVLDQVYVYGDTLVFAAFDREEKLVAVYGFDTTSGKLFAISNQYDGTEEDVYMTAVTENGEFGFSVEGGQQFIYLELGNGATDHYVVKEAGFAGVCSVTNLNGKLCFEMFDMTGEVLKVLRYDSEQASFEELTALATGVVTEEKDE